MKIIIAEDEPSMQKILRLYLEKAGYEVTVTSDGHEALEKLYEENYDLLIADWMMPKMNGLELCKEVRACSLPIKIIMLTAKSEAQSEITGLTCGADDYIKKPFEPRILLLRIQKMFRLEDVLTCGRLTLSPENRTVYLGRNEIRSEKGHVEGHEVRFTQKEFQLLEFFMRNKGLTMSREVLLDRIWGSDYDGDERTLDTHIRRLRGKIGKNYITTYVGVGYRMDEPHE